MTKLFRFLARTTLFLTLCGFVALTNTSDLMAQVETEIDEPATPVEATDEGTEALAEPGLKLMDKAMQAKITASRLSDLDLVVSLCRSAIEQGLSESNQAFAKEMITATLYEKANRLVEPALKGADTSNFERRRIIAREALVEALKNDPDHGESHLLLARLESVDEGNVELGRKSADRSVELLATIPARQSVAYLARAAYQEDVKDRLSDLDRAVELDDQNFEARRERGRVYLISGNTQAAMEDFKRLLELDSRDLQALDSVARVFAVQKEYDKALEYVQKMIDMNPELAEPYALRASVRIMQEQPEEALSDLDKAVELDSRDVFHRLSRARVLGALDRHEKALKDVEHVLTRNPGFVPAISAKIGILASLERYDEAADAMKPLAQLDPSNHELQLQLAALYLAAKRPSAAIKVYSAIADSNEPPWEVFRNRADAYLSIGQHAEAIADYETAIKKQPEDDGVLNNLAWVLATSTIDGLRDGKRAIELAMKACELTEFKQAHILSTLAAGYAETGDFEKAQEWSAKAVEFGEGPVKEQLEAELESYRQAKPWREMNVVEDATDLGTSDDDLELPPADKVTTKEKPRRKSPRIPADP